MKLITGRSSTNIDKVMLMEHIEANDPDTYTLNYLLWKGTQESTSMPILTGTKHTFNNNGMYPILDTIVN